MLDSGLNAGQRVEFEAAQCEAFGCSLENADLSQIFNYSKYVYLNANRKVAQPAQVGGGEFKLKACHENPIHDLSIL